MNYQHVKVPTSGSKITTNPDFSLNVPDEPIIPFIEGDGIGADVTPVMRKVIDAAIEKAYSGSKKIHWMEIFAGEKSTKVYGDDVWMPEETLHILKDYVVSIKGPLTTPVGGGIRSLNVAMRQKLDLYTCLRPIRYYPGTPLVRKAMQYAIDNDKASVTIVHKGNIMKFTEGGFKEWAYELAKEEFGQGYYCKRCNCRCFLAKYIASC